MSFRMRPIYPYRVSGSRRRRTSCARATAAAEKLSRPRRSRRLLQRSRSRRPRSCHHGHRTHDAATARDPVCGMTVDPATGKHRADHRGATYYFCSAGCRTKFVADPARYLDKGQAGRRPPCRKARSTPARCIRRSGRSARAPARSAAWRWSRVVATADAGPNPELDRHDAPVLDRPRARAAGRRAGDGRPSDSALHDLIEPATVELDPARARDAGRAVGRLAVLRARLAVAA